MEAAGTVVGDPLSDASCDGIPSVSGLAAASDRWRLGPDRLVSGRYLVESEVIPGIVLFQRCVLLFVRESLKKPGRF